MPTRHRSAWRRRWRSSRRLRVAVPIAIPEGYSFILLPVFSDGNSGDWAREILSTFPQPKMNIS